SELKPREGATDLQNIETGTYRCGMEGPWILDRSRKTIGLERKWPYFASQLGVESACELELASPLWSEGRLPSFVPSGIFGRQLPASDHKLVPTGSRFETRSSTRPRS